jgi:hypothetical protein
MNNYLETADLLKQEAKSLLHKKGLAKVLSKYGKIFEFGSYALDVMVWPDLDLYLEVEKVPTPRYVLGSLVKDLLSIESFVYSRVETELWKKNNIFPKGEYIQLKERPGIWRQPWKVDIWVVDKNQLKEKRAWLKSTKEKLTPEKRELILEHKHRFITEKGKTPQFGGYFIYEAVLDKHYTTGEQVRQHLEKNGVNPLPEDFEFSSKA